tara:strand:- start:1753 stop:1962 length:210 start_codon:yes stop_codon:yes gene_type:complete
MLRPEELHWMLYTLTKECDGWWKLENKILMSSEDSNKLSVLLEMYADMLKEFEQEDKDEKDGSNYASNE